MIAFDLFGVILEEGHLISNGLLQQLPASIDKNHVKSLYQQLNLSLITEDTFWASLGVPDSGPIRQAFLNSFTLDPGYHNVIDSIKSQYQLSILSNLPADWARELSRKFNFAEIFKPCVFSGHTRCKKPEPEIYLELIKQSKLSADQIIFIDDRLENLQTANALGFGTIYYQRENDTTAFTADYKIRALAELLDLV